MALSVFVTVRFDYCNYMVIDATWFNGSPTTSLDFFIPDRFHRSDHLLANGLLDHSALGLSTIAIHRLVKARILDTVHK